MQIKPKGFSRKTPVLRPRRFTSWFFPSYLLLSAIALLALAITARQKPYFALDLVLEQRVQAFRPTWFDRLMRWLSWTGYAPQANIFGGAIIIGLLALGLRWEAEMEAAIIGGAAAMFFSVLLLVKRPRPSAQLVRVNRTIRLTGFPSGHVLTFTSSLGFIGFLVYSSQLPRLVRRALLSLIGLVIASVGVARIYSGEHWPSDVAAGYLLGASWLGLGMRIYSSRRKVTRQIARRGGQ